jgi:hypothetical protein
MHVLAMVSMVLLRAVLIIVYANIGPGQEVLLQKSPSESESILTGRCGN